MHLKDFKKGIIIRNGIEETGSWTKRLNHWRKSFTENSIETIIISAYPQKPKSFKNGENSIYYLLNIKLPRVIQYLISPFVLLKKLIKEKPQFVLIVHGGFFEFYTIPLYCKFAKIPLLVDIVDTIGRMYKNKKSIFDYIVLYNKKLFDKFILKKAYEIFVISSTLENHYKTMFPKKKITKSYPTTVDIEEFVYISNKDTSYFNNKAYDVFNSSGYLKIFYAGTIARTNGVEFFLKIISELISEYDIKIKIIFAIIIGDVKNLQDLFSKYNLINNSEIVPTVKQEELPILLCKSDILFIPEQGKETANAGFPGKTAEYLLSGKPVISTNFSDLSQYLINGENAFISEIGDSETYKNNLKQLIYDKNLRKKIGNSGRELAINNFSHINCANPFIYSVQEFYVNKTH